MSLLITIPSKPGPLSGGGGGTTQLSAPVLSAGSPLGSDINMDWDDIANKSNYTIEIAGDSGFTSGVISSTLSPSTKDYTGLAVGTYYLRVKANGDGISFTDSDWSNVVSIDIDIPFSLSTATTKIVRAGGTIGVNCDYTSIWSAIDAITDASSGNQYILDVKNGTYNENGYFNTGLGFYTGIAPKHYVHIIGESTAGVIINGPSAASPGNEVAVDTFHTPANCLIQNVTIKALNAKYCVHADYSLYDYSLYLKDCVLTHMGSVSGFNDPIGCGLYGGQKIVLLGCTLNGEGFYAHGNATNTRDTSKHFEILLKSCNMPKFLWQDYIEYAANTITLTDNTVTEVNLQTITTVYDANPGNPACNTGTKVYTSFTNSGNTVTTVTRDSETAAILGTTMNDPTDFL